MPTLLASLWALPTREKARILLAVVFLSALGCLWLWQPERQVSLHQRHLLHAAETRDWPKIKESLDDSFHTSYGHDKPTALALLADALRPFFTLQIIASEPEITIKGNEGTVRTLLRLNGTGMSFAEIVQNTVNESQEPFEFTWRRVNWKPWDWRLIRASHPVIGLAAGHLPIL